jgi:transcriptional regulator with XRE-family HTH domain
MAQEIRVRRGVEGSGEKAGERGYVPVFWDSSAQFGAYLRRIRIERGWTSREAGDKLGFSQAYVSALENKSRKQPPGMELIHTIVDGYGLDLQEVLREAGFRFPVPPSVDLELIIDEAFDRLMAEEKVRPPTYETQQARFLSSFAKQQILDLVLKVARAAKEGFDVEALLRGGTGG